MEYKYDVALSFAGEDRHYVNEVADYLKKNGVRVFYDKFEEVDLWGRDLGLHFDSVYRRESKYFIPFISAYYKEKIWTNYEIKTAIARAIENKEDYILPVRFDKTELEGIRSTIGFLDISKLTSQELGQKIIAKLGGKINNPTPEKKEVDGIIHLSSYLMYEEFSGQIRGIQIGITVTNKTREYKYFNTPYFKISQALEGSSNTFNLLDVEPILNFPVKMESGQPFQLMYNLRKGFLDRMAIHKGKEVTLTAIVTTTFDEKFISNPLNVDDLFLQ